MLAGKRDPEGMGKRDVSCRPPSPQERADNRYPGSNGETFSPLLREHNRPQGTSETTMAKAKKTKHAEKATTDTVAKGATKPSAEERAQKAAEAKSAHKASASAKTRELLDTIQKSLTKVLAAVEDGKTAPKEFDALHAAVAEFKVEVNRLGIHARPQAAKAKE